MSSNRLKTIYLVGFDRDLLDVMQGHKSLSNASVSVDMFSDIQSAEKFRAGTLLDIEPWLTREDPERLVENHRARQERHAANLFS